MTDTKAGTGAGAREGSEAGILACLVNFLFLESWGKKDRISIAITILIACFFLGLLTVLLFSLRSLSLSTIISVAGAGLVLSAGMFFLGGLLGFLFGIPKKLQDPGFVPTPDSGQGTSQNTNDSRPHYQTNTNLEQISDWLTKILVGVGLTQLTTAPDQLEKYSVALAPSLGGLPNGGAFAAGLLIFFTINGFLVGYLWTRRYFAHELEQSEIELENLERMAKQDAINAEANKLVDCVISSTPGTPQPSQADLNTIFSRISDSTREAIYYRAAYIRERFFVSDKALMELTEKIFRALIANDPQNMDYHGHLGYVLLGKRKPDYKAAMEEFTTAINIRGPWRDQLDSALTALNLWYEYGRAYCIIKTDEEFLNKKPSSEKAKKSILDDLDAASKNLDIKEVIDTDSVILEWKNLNVP